MKNFNCRMSKIGIMIILSSLFFSYCKKKKLSEVGKPIIEMAIGVVGESVYNECYKLITEELDYHEQLEYGVCINPDNTYIDYIVPKILCFNSNGNRFIGTVYIRLSRGLNQEMSLLGFKRKGKWHFFILNAVQAVINTYWKGYTRQDTVPIELFYQRAQEGMSSYLIKDNEGNWQINDAWFERMFENNGFHSTKDSMTRDEYKNAPDDFWEEKYYKYILSRQNRIKKHIEERNNSN